MSEDYEKELKGTFIEPFSLDEACNITGRLEEMFCNHYRKIIHDNVDKLNVIHETLKEFWNDVGTDLHPMYERFFKTSEFTYLQDDSPENLKKSNEFSELKTFESYFELMFYHFFEKS